MKAKLFITGQSEPLELEEAEAVAAQKLIADSTRPNDTAFSIEGVWAGKKKDMRYVKFPEHERELHNPNNIEPLNDAEADKMLADIKEAKKRAREALGEKQEYKWPDFLRALRGVGKIEIGHFHRFYAINDLDAFNAFEEKYKSFEATMRIRDSRETAEKHKLQQLDEIAQQGN